MDSPVRQEAQSFDSAGLSAKLLHLSIARGGVELLLRHSKSLLAPCAVCGKLILDHGRSAIVEQFYMIECLRQMIVQLEKLDNLLALEFLISGASANLRNQDSVGSEAHLDV